MSINTELMALVIAASLLLLKVGSKIVDHLWSKNITKEPTNGAYLAAIHEVAAEVRNHDTTEREHHDRLVELLSREARTTAEVLNKLAVNQASMIEILRMISGGRRHS